MLKPEPLLREKPYAFVPIPESLRTRPPVWHDGSGADGSLLSGEVRFELANFTPLLVGCERRSASDPDGGDPWCIPCNPMPHGPEPEKSRVSLLIDGVGQVVAGKAVVCPLRAPWGERPVLLPGDSLKGLLRHELGALLGAPMERVEERSYSYRPNSVWVRPTDQDARLVARIARVVEGKVETRPLDPNNAGAKQVRIPTELELLPLELQYDRQHNRPQPHYRFDPQTGGSVYRGGMGAG
ncbi:MAG TPA: hypothetical protein VK689_06290, partial [Armatimonadota bacterium]|nr:hypothetical protein [Armatimonadota bacterium]